MEDTFGYFLTVTNKIQDILQEENNHNNINNLI